MNSEEKSNRRNELMLANPDFVFVPNKKCIYSNEFCFKFTLDVIKRIPKFTSKKIEVCQEIFALLEIYLEFQFHQ